jgi:hypothetical protein
VNTEHWGMKNDSEELMYFPSNSYQQQITHGLAQD